MDLALGLRPHSGWAIAVAVAAPPEPELVWRSRVTVLADGDPKQPWHAAQGLGLSPAAADELVAGVTAGARAAADAVITAAVDLGVVAVGIAGVPRDVPSTERVLANHSLLHYAEGELYRGVLADAAEAAGLPVVGIAPADLAGDVDEHASILDALRKEHGPPWQADHKLATVVAWAALASVARR
jgi:hypothetical protein